MPISLVNKFMREGLTKKQAEAKAARITNAQKRKRKK